MAEGLPAGAPDPRDALYWANNAALEFSRNQAKIKTAGEREQTEAGYKYNAGQLRRALPQRLTANRNQANSQGLAESGQLAQTQGRTQTDYAGKEGRLSEQRRMAMNNYTNRDAAAEGEYAVGAGKNLVEGTERSRVYAEEHPPQAAPAAPVSSGVVPREYTSNGQMVRIGMPPRSTAVGTAVPSRAGAIAKIKKRSGY